MGKITLLAILILAGFAFFNKDKVADYKRKAIETVNPSAKEKRLINELGASLIQLDNLLSDPSDQLSQERASKEAKATLNSLKETLNELRNTNEKTDLGANISNLIQKIIPFNSDPSPTWLPPTECN